MALASVLYAFHTCARARIWECRAVKLMVLDEYLISRRTKYVPVKPVSVPLRTSNLPKRAATRLGQGRDFTPSVLFPVVFHLYQNGR